MSRLKKRSEMIYEFDNGYGASVVRDDNGYSVLGFKYVDKDVGWQLDNVRFIGLLYTDTDEDEVDVVLDEIGRL